MGLYSKPLFNTTTYAYGAYGAIMLNVTSQTVTVFLCSNLLCCLIKNHDPYNDYHFQTYQPQCGSRLCTDPVETSCTYYIYMTSLQYSYNMCVCV